MHLVCLFEMPSTCIQCDFDMIACTESSRTKIKVHTGEVEVL